MPVEIDIEHVARLARVTLTEAEKALLSTQLPAILEHAARVGELDLDDVPPTAQAMPRSNVLRPDEPEPSLPHHEAMASAPDQEDDRFKVPRITEIG